jgi:hypothetical protein
MRGLKTRNNHGSGSPVTPCQCLGGDGHAEGESNVVLQRSKSNMKLWQQRADGWKAYPPRQGGSRDSHHLRVGRNLAPSL